MAKLDKADNTWYNKYIGYYQRQDSIEASAPLSYGGKRGFNPHSWFQ